MDIASFISWAMLFTLLDLAWEFIVLQVLDLRSEFIDSTQLRNYKNGTEQSLQNKILKLNTKFQFENTTLESI